MQICGIGIDIVETNRIRGIRYLGRFAELFLSPNEVGQFNDRHDKIDFLSSRFAAKEAVIKAFPHTITAADFEILKEGPKPYVRFFNPVHEQYRVHVSLSHSTEYAAGYAMVEKV